MQMFAEDKCLSIGRLCEKNGTSCYSSYMRDGIPKKSKLLWKLNAAGRCVSVSEVRGDAARCGGTRPRSVFRGVDCQ